MNEYAIAVCIPSINEVSSIRRTTTIISKGLKDYFPMFRSIIVNVDNNSIDGTSKEFMSTNTFGVDKISILTNTVGKGENILNFMKFAEKEKIPYLATFDADLISITPLWVKQLITPIINNDSQYVLPIYKRNRYEGNTTNHFCFPIIYCLTGTGIRQPIAGDFAFSLNYAENFLQQQIPDTHRKYGIDIAMTLFALLNKYSITQVQLDKKIHNPSFGKMIPMFMEVASSLIWIINNNRHKVRPNVTLSVDSISLINSIIEENNPPQINAIEERKEEARKIIEKTLQKNNCKLANHLQFALHCHNKDGQYTYIHFNEAISQMLKEIISTSLELSDIQCYAEAILGCYLVRVLSYINEVKNMSPKQVDSLINSQALNLIKNFDIISK